MPVPVTRRCPLSCRPLRAALICVAVLVFAGLLSPARGLAADGPWTPGAAGQVKTARPCPSPVVAAYYDTTCWTVSPDDTDPFYFADGASPWAQCTYWALEMRPDLWNARSATDPDPGDWTAYTWPAHAELQGLTVDDAPAAGAVIVWPRTAGNDTGHVAYIQAVSHDSTTRDVLVTVQEMNDTTFDDPSLGQGDTMTLPMDAQDLAGVRIIHAPGDSAGETATTGSGDPASGSTAPPSSTAPTRTRQTAHPTGTISSVSKRSSARRPRLSVRIAAHALVISTVSPAPPWATVASLSAHASTHRLRLRAGSPVSLPSGRARVCVSQRATRVYAAARACALRDRADGGRFRLRLRLRLSAR